jgi:DNA (cytosine-5)-methyltransferase 1
MGYHRAGFDVTGVDNRPQPRYPFAFVQGDALEFVALHGHEYDAIAASPPCQGYSATQSLWRREHPKMIAAVRTALRATGLPYAIENVEGARKEMVGPVMLCGAAFGLKVYRHRLFECSFSLLVPPHGAHRAKVLNRRYVADWGGFVTVTGGGNSTKAVAARAMGIDWMTRDELAQAIPPAYTELIGRALLAHLQHTERAA